MFTRKWKKLLFGVLAPTVILILVTFISFLMFRHPGNLERTGGFLHEEYPDSYEAANRDRMGVTIYHPKLSYEGYNLYKNRLLDMKGEVVHEWSKNIRLMKISENGKIIAKTSVPDRPREQWKFGKYKWTGEPLWEKKLHIHHHFESSDKNTIVAIHSRQFPFRGRRVLFDIILEYSDLGHTAKILHRWSTFEHLIDIQRYHSKGFLDMPGLTDDFFAKKFRETYHERLDYYHINYVNIFPENLSGRKDNRFRKGNWLLSLAHKNLLLILDRDSKEIVWQYGTKELDYQHTPIMLPEGNILIFDNGRFLRGYSRVIELNPITRRIVWEYRADPPESFYTHIYGAAQRLPNGNTLITESCRGRVFEITRKGRTVWEYYHTRFQKQGPRRFIYRMERYSPQKIEKFLPL